MFGAHVVPAGGAVSVLPASATIATAAAVVNDNGTSTYEDCMDGATVAPPVDGFYCVTFEGTWFFGATDETGAVALSLNGAIVPLLSEDGLTTERIYDFPVGGDSRSPFIVTAILELVTTDDVGGIFKSLDPSFIEMTGVRRINLWQVNEPGVAP